jgi:hypothetical protein
MTKASSLLECMLAGKNMIHDTTPSGCARYDHMPQNIYTTFPQHDTTYRTRDDIEVVSIVSLKK